MRQSLFIRRALIAGFALVMGTGPSIAQPAPAQNPPAPIWPQHAVRMIPPLGPGSGMDVAARLFAEKLSQKWGQPVVVENRQGADGILAVQSFMTDRDNHSLIFGFAGLISINPLIHGDKLPYDLRDVVPVASAIDSTLALTVSDTLKVDSLEGFVKAAREQPGKINWAATTGLPLYVVAALQKVANIDLPSELTADSWFQNAKSAHRTIKLTDVRIGREVQPPLMPTPLHGALVMDNIRHTAYRIDTAWRRITKEIPVSDGNIRHEPPLSPDEIRRKGPGDRG